MILSVHVKGKQRIMFYATKKVFIFDDPWSTILRKYELTHSSNQKKPRMLDEISLAVTYFLHDFIFQFWFVELKREVWGYIVRGNVSSDLL